MAILFVTSDSCLNSEYFEYVEEIFGTYGFVRNEMCIDKFKKQK
jgi:hypothetical protein